MRYTDGFLRVAPSGRHVGVLKYKDPEGRWRQVTRTFTESRAESERMMREWRESMGSPGGNGSEGPTVEQAVRSVLSAQLARGRIERSTHDAQLACAARHLFPALGAEPLAGLAPRAVQEWVDSLCLSASRGTARAACSVLGKACRAAEREGLVARSPMSLVELPARKPPSRSYLPPAQAAALLRAAGREWGRSSAPACAVALALYAGLRAGECCGLRWRDVGARAISVTSSVGRSDAGCYLKGPKSAAGARNVPVVGPLAAALDARAREAGREPGRFVCGEGGRFADPRALSCRFKDLCEREGIADSEGRRATFHSLRRTFATEAVRAGVDARTLADMMGHSGAEVTLNVYAASAADAREAAAARLEEALSRVWG